MASTGNVYCGLGANVDRGGTSNVWSNPTNIYGDNTQYANATVPTDYLVASTFGFAIPDGATINGVTLRFEAYETGTGGTNVTAQLHSNTTPTLIGSSKAQAANTISGTTPTVHTLGGTADVWGASLTPAIVNATGFGVSIWSTDTTNVLYIDYVQLAIEYTEAGGVKDVIGIGVVPWSRP